MKKCSFFLVILTFLLSFAQVYAEDGVATVIIMRGEVKAKEKDSENIITVTKGMWIKEGTVLQSASKSFAKLLFIDKSEMSLGPESQMIISSFPKDQAGILTLVKGQLRSKVTKDYMEMADKDKSKLYIKTKSAAMGVRGTDFQVNFDRKSSATTLVTFQGAVAMARIAEAANKAFDRNALESTLRSKDAVLVQRGQFAGTAPSKAATTPQKVPDTTLQTLKDTDGTQVIKEAISGLINATFKADSKEEKKENGKENNGDKKDDKKDTEGERSVIPPGLSGDQVSNNGADALDSALGGGLVAGVKQELTTEPGREPASTTGPAPTPEATPVPPKATPIPMLTPLPTPKPLPPGPPPVYVDPNTKVRLIFH